MGLKEAILFSCIAVIIQVKAFVPHDNHITSPNALLTRKRVTNRNDYNAPSKDLFKYENTAKFPGMTKRTISQNNVSKPEADCRHLEQIPEEENHRIQTDLLDYTIMEDAINILNQTATSKHENIFKKQNLNPRKAPVSKQTEISKTSEIHSRKPIYIKTGEIETKAVNSNRGKKSRNERSIEDVDTTFNATDSTLKFEQKDSLHSFAKPSQINFSKDTIRGSSERREHTFLRNMTNFITTNFSSFVFNPFANTQDVFQECNTPTNESGTCRYVQHCLLPSMVSSLNEFLNHMCIIQGRFIGICCPKDPVTTLVINSQSALKNDSSMNGPQNLQELSLECGVSSNTRIVGGTNADPKAWPWMVALLWKLNKKFFCGGVLINDQYVLTAAHCTFGVPFNQIIARIGEYDFSSTNSSRDDYAVVKIKRHGRYSQIRLTNDIALLKLEKSVSFKKSARNICLPEKNSSYVNKIATLSGWGNVQGGGSSSSILQEASFTIITNEECSKVYNVPIPSSLICAASDLKIGACNGDSGGPLMLLDDENRWKVIGIVSWGRRGCKTEFPTAYTRVSQYLRWIKKHAQ